MAMVRGFTNHNELCRGRVIAHTPPLIWIKNVYAHQDIIQYEQKSGSSHIISQVPDISDRDLSRDHNYGTPKTCRNDYLIISTRSILKNRRRKHV